MNCPFCDSLPETMGKDGPDQPTRCSDTANYCIASFDWTPRRKWDTRAAKEGNQWQPIETAPKDGSAVLLLSIPYELDAGPNGKHWIQAKCAIGKWWAEGTSWVQDGPRDEPTYDLAMTGVWLSGGGWFQPNEVSHWMPLPDPPQQNPPTNSP